MGSVFVGRMILAVILHSLKQRAGWPGHSPPVVKQAACMMSFAKLHKN